MSRFFILCSFWGIQLGVSVLLSRPLVRSNGSVYAVVEPHGESNKITSASRERFVRRADRKEPKQNGKTGFVSRWHKNSEVLVEAEAEQKQKKLDMFGYAGSVPRALLEAGHEEAWEAFRPNISAFEKPEFGDGQPKWLYDNIFRYTMGKNKNPKDHIFVEFGAEKGLFQDWPGSSNTELFEKMFGWQGLLIEPLPKDVPELRKNRACAMSTNEKDGSCILTGLDNGTGKTLYFGQADDEMAKDTPGSDPTGWITKTTTLDALYDRFNISEVDFLSADCQGCELRALQGMDFAKTPVSVLQVELSEPELSCAIKEMMDLHGYLNIHLNTGYDTIFLHPSIVKALRYAPKPIPIMLYRKDTLEQKKQLMAKCSATNTWTFGSPWPPQDHSTTATAAKTT